MLDQDGITAAALQLIGKSGYDGFTMAALARTLNVAPSALYNHVSSKRDVLVLVQDHLTSFVDVAAFEAEPWDQAVRDWAWSYRDVFSKHTPLIPVIAVLPVTDAPKTLAMYEAVSAGFGRAGFPAGAHHLGDCGAGILHLRLRLRRHGAGGHLRFRQHGGVDAAFHRRRRSAWPRTGHRKPADVAFSLGLEALIAGLGALRAA